jgi:hypothetical protein
MASAAALAGAEDKVPPKTPYIEIVTLRAHFGEQSERLGAWIEKRAMPLFKRHLDGPIGIFNVEIGPHIPAMVIITTYPNLAVYESETDSLYSDPEWLVAVSEAEATGAPFFRLDSTLLHALPFSPPLKAAVAGDPAHKIFELRTYESSSFRQIDMMHQRFHPQEIDVFAKCGIKPIFYADTFVGSNQPNMVYMVPFESEAQREQAWAAFRVHPGWKAIADEWMKKSGELARNIYNTILVPTNYSMIR